MIASRNTLCILFASLGASILAGCSNSVGDALDSRRNVGPCPSAGSLYTASRIIEFSGETEAFSEVAFTGEIIDVDFFCRYAGEEPIEAEVQIDFAFGKGPAASRDSHTYGYFVAVTRRNSHVLEREDFEIVAEFDGKTVTAAREVIRPIEIPRAEGTISGANFEILVGFVLTEDQLAFNRAGKRFRLDAQQSGS